MIRCAPEVDDLMAGGLDRIRAELDIPTDFDVDVIAAAEEAAARPLGAGRADRTDQAFVTLDPESSIDLDQAFDITVDGNDIVLHYAIADVGWFVRPGDPLDVEAFRRGVTIYLPDQRSTLYPTVLSEAAASLLPDVDRPAVVFRVRVDPSGHPTLDGVERALIRSRAKLAYDQVTSADLPEGFAELHRRIVAAETERGAPRVEFPEQQIEASDGCYELTFRPRLPSEEQNAAMSLATNLAVGRALFEARTGLFRTMPEVDERHLWRLRNSARAFGLDWPRHQPLDEFERSLPRDDPRTSAFLVAVRRAGGGAGYERFQPGVVPWHAAVKATYAQATAPLRRLQDRYVIEAVLAVANHTPVPPGVLDAFERLPKAMAAADQRAGAAERQALELAEAVLLTGREGEVFDAVVVDETRSGAEIQIESPAIMARVSAKRVDPGDRVKVQLKRIQLDERLAEFERVG